MFKKNTKTKYTLPQIEEVIKLRLEEFNLTLIKLDINYQKHHPDIVKVTDSFITYQDYYGQKWKNTITSFMLKKCFTIQGDYLHDYCLSNKDLKHIIELHSEKVGLEVVDVKVYFKQNGISPCLYSTKITYLKDHIEYTKSALNFLLTKNAEKGNPIIHKFTLSNGLVKTLDRYEWYKLRKLTKNKNGILLEIANELFEIWLFDKNKEFRTHYN